MIKSTVCELSAEIFLGLKNGTSIPKDFEILAIFSLSVLTIILLIFFELFAAFIEYSINGLLYNFLIFFCGIPFEPPRAGIIAKIFIL